MAIKLPEKDYFTRDEIAQHWECGLDLVDHYIEHGYLREALVLTKECFSKLQRFKYFKCNVDSKIFRMYVHSLVEFEDLTDLLAQSETEFDSSSIVSCPKYAYFEDEKRMLNYEEKVEFSVTFDGVSNVCVEKDVLRPRLVFIAGLGDDRYIPTSVVARGKYKNKPGTKTRYFMDFHLSDKSLANRFIPREERDRFEALHNTQNDRPLTVQPTDTNNPAIVREAKNRKRLIAMMLELLTAKDKRFNSQSELVDYLSDEPRKVDGLSKRNLEKIFASANKIMKEEK